MGDESKLHYLNNRYVFFSLSVSRAYRDTQILCATMESDYVANISFTTSAKG
jgi:hypothetical protein